MSAVVKTITPFIHKDCLCQALDDLEVNYSINKQSIVTERKDYAGFQKFVFEKGQYQYQHDADANRVGFSSYSKNIKSWKTTTAFLKAVESKYRVIYSKLLEELEQKRLDEERKKIEEERKTFVENRRKGIIEKAKAQGYSVQEKKVKNKIKLILVKNTY
jgi:hypothetical protein